MDIDLRSKINIFKECYTEVSKELRFDNNRIKILQSFLYMTTNEEFNYNKIKEIRKYIKKSELGINFNGNVKKIMAIFLYSNNDYKNIVKKTAVIYHHLINKGFKKDKFTEFISFDISIRFPQKEYDNIIKKMIYVKETLEHRLEIKFESNIEILCFFNLSAVSMDCDEIIRNYLEIYDKLLNYKMNKCECFYSASMLMLINDKKNINRVEKINEIRQCFDENNIKLQNEDYLLIGLSALVIDKSERFVDNVIEVYKYLFVKKIFKKNILMLLSIALVLSQYVEVISMEHTNFFEEREVNILNRLLEYVCIMII